MKKYNRLEVVEEFRSKGRVYFRCKCDCGKIKDILKYDVVKEKSKSCGCLRVEEFKERSTTHGMRNTRFYRIWLGMRDRCSNKNTPSYKRYGGRGITVCDKWSSFEGFKEDMYVSYKKHVEKHGEQQTSINRVNNDKGYCLENCRWATHFEQIINRRTGSNNTSGVRGVSFYAPSEKWRARICVKGETIYLGYFDNLNDAREARRIAEDKYFTTGN